MPTRIIQGNRVGKQGRIRVGCSATLFDAERKRVFLTRRTDNGLWCLPGGGMDPGETLEETCIREMREETGLTVRVKRLIGIYSNPNILVVYPDGNSVQIVAANFEVECLEGSAQTSIEVSEYGYYTVDDLDKLDLMVHHRERILDAFHSNGDVYYR